MYAGQMVEIEFCDNVIQVPIEGAQSLRDPARSSHIMIQEGP
jgi:hypothetical protein